jgi:hypothetical protein
MKTSNKLLYWSPRILAILAISFVSLFALDAFHPGEPLATQLAHFFMHMIPSFVLLAILLIAWRWEFVGGIIFALIGVVTSPLIFMHNYRMNDSIGLSLLIILMITIPFIVIGGLFIWHHYRKKIS